MRSLRWNLESLASAAIRSTGTGYHCRAARSEREGERPRGRATHKAACGAVIRGVLRVHTGYHGNSDSAAMGEDELNVSLMHHGPAGYRRRAAAAIAADPQGRA